MQNERLTLPADEWNDRLIAALVRLRRRLRWRDSLRVAARWGWVAFLLAFALQAISWVVPFERADWLSAGTVLAVGAGWLGWTLLRPISLDTVAHRVDAEAGLKERLATALEYAGGRAANAGPVLVRRQLADAVAAAERAAEKSADVLPVTWSRRRISFAAVLLAGALALAILPNPQQDVIADRRAVRERAQQEAARIEDVREELSERETLPREERERLLQELDELAAQLRQNPGDRERALADIERAREALRDHLDPNAGARRAALEQLSRRLSQLSKRERAGDSLQDGADALGELAQRTGERSPQERAETAAALREQAGQVAAGDSELAQALNELAGAIERGDGEAAAEAAQQGEQALREAAGEMQDQQALSRALGELEDSRQALAQAGRGQQNGQNAASEGGQGQGQGQTQAGGTGRGQGGQQAGGGGGTNANQLPPSTRSGQFGGSDPSQVGAGSQTGDYEPRVFSPLPPQGSTERDRIQGQQSGDGQTLERERRDPGAGAGGNAVVPMRDVLPAYEGAAARALEQEYIPSGMREYVREYFTQLGGGR